MNKKNKNLAYLCILVAIILFFGLVWGFVVPSYNEFESTKSQLTQNEKELERLEAESAKIKDKQAKEELQLKSLKQIYQNDLKGNSDNLSVFGTMFDDLIKTAQANGLLIRSIEYDMNPSFDPIVSNFATQYNACELKFFFVGSYSQLKTYLNEITVKFPYLLSISSLNVTAFPENTDYLLIKLSVNLYSKKPEDRK
jgi:hypothetical protein